MSAQDYLCCTSFLSLNLLFGGGCYIFFYFFSHWLVSGPLHGIKRYRQSKFMPIIIATLHLLLSRNLSEPVRLDKKVVYWLVCGNKSTQAKQQCIQCYCTQSSSTFCAKSMEYTLNVSATFCPCTVRSAVFCVSHSVSMAPVCVSQMIEDVLGEGPVSASRFSQWFSSNMSPSGSRSSSLRSTPHEELEKLAGKWFNFPEGAVSWRMLVENLKIRGLFIKKWV